MTLKTTSIALLLGTCLATHLDASAAAPSTYSAGPTFGTVVDDVTGAPVAGAVVVAQWILEAGAPIERVGVLVVRETVTDASGNFRIEGWGPIQRPSRGVLDALDPDVLVFKSGFVPWGYSNWGLARPGSRIGLSQRDWLRNGGTFRLKDVPSTVTDLQRKALVTVVRTALYQVLESNDCKWTHVPRAIRLLETELARVNGPAASDSGSDFLTRKDCGSLDAFKRAYEASH